MTGAPQVSVLSLPADLAALRELGPWLRDLLDRAGAGELHSRLELALHEVCVNVVRHAYDDGPGTVDVAGSVGPAAVELTVTDHGAAFDSTAVTPPTPGEPQVHGYGLLLVEQLVDRLDYLRTEGQNRWLLQVSR